MLKNNIIHNLSQCNIICYAVHVWSRSVESYFKICELQLTTANAKLNVLRKEKRIGQKERKTKFDHILYREMARHCNDIIRQYVFL